MVFPHITDASAPFNHQRPVHQTDQEIYYGLVDDQVFTMALKLALLHKYNDDDDIEDDNGQTFSTQYS